MTNSIMRRTYRFRLKPTKKQDRALAHSLEICREAHNAGLQERRDAWRTCRKSVSYYDQSAQIKPIRAIRPDVEAVAFVFIREALRRLDRSFQNFYRRVKRKEFPGFPRFKSPDRYDSLTIYSSHFSLDDGRVKLPKIGCVRFKAHRKIKGTPKQCTIKRLGSKWQVSIVCDLGPVPEKLPVRNAVGMDVGLATFATLSDGGEVQNPRWTWQAADEVAAKNQALSRKQRGSKNRQKAKEALRGAHQRIANRRLNFCHQVSKDLVSKYDLIAFEDLRVPPLLRGTFSKAVLDTAWKTLIFCITYKAANAGRWAVPVDPRGTTQRCSACGDTVHKDLAERVHSCPRCGLILGRDHNAAINILQAGRACAGLQSQEGSS